MSRPGTDTLAIFVSNTIHGQVIQSIAICYVSENRNVLIDRTTVRD